MKLEYVKRCSHTFSSMKIFRSLLCFPLNYSMVTPSKQNKLKIERQIYTVTKRLHILLFKWEKCFSLKLEVKCQVKLLYKPSSVFGVSSFALGLWWSQHMWSHLDQLKVNGKNQIVNLEKKGRKCLNLKAGPVFWGP